MHKLLPDHPVVAERTNKILEAVGVEPRSGELSARTPITGGSLGAAGSPADVDARRGDSRSGVR